MKRSIRLLVATVAVALPLAIPGSAPADTPTLVGVDNVGDWGVTLDPTLPPVGDALGQDLRFAFLQIDEADPGIVNFIIQVANLPEIGGAPEVSRYVWDAQVYSASTGAAGKLLELDGKYTNYSRGACDATSGQCPPPRDPGPQPFIVRGNCITTGTLVTCEELGIVQATFDTVSDTITIPVPVSLIGPAGECPKSLGAGVNIFGGSISASPSAYFTTTSMPMDTMTIGLEDPEVLFEIC